jgi:two-component system response regulator MtrA
MSDSLPIAGMSFRELILQEEPLQPLVFSEGERPASIFIVDDEPMVGEVVGMVLGIEGFKTRVFTSPEDALDALETATEKPGILITDFAMTPMNGLELIGRFKKAVPALRTILYSGAITDNEAAAFRHGADAFLNKPFLPRELIRIVRSVVPK